MLTFEPVSHTYRFSDRKVPSVTQLLSCMSNFGFLTAEELEAAQDRGTYCHQLCHYDDIGDLDEAAECTGEHWPRLLAWRRFCRDYGANWEGIEELGYSRHFGYAGTLDRRGVLTLHEKAPTARWIIDIKTSATLYRKPWGAQTAAYRHMIAEVDPMWALARRASVRLLVDVDPVTGERKGRYIFDELDNPKDWVAFSSLIHLLDWRNS